MISRCSTALSAVVLGGAALIAGAPASAFAQTQVPGTPYTRFQSAHTYVPLASGMPISFNGTDDGEATVTLPFSFKFYEAQVTQLTVGTNGAIVMSPGVEITFTNQVLGSSTLHGLIAPWWDDLIVSGADVVNMAVEGTAPARAVVIEFRNIPRLAGGANVSFQVRFHEGNAGLLQIDFGTATGSGWTASSGMEDLAGNRPILFTATNCGTSCTPAEFPTNTRIELVQDPGVELVALGVNGPEFAFLGALTQIPVDVINLHGQTIGPFNVQVTASTDPLGTNPVVIGTSTLTLTAFQGGTFNVPSAFPASFGESVVYVQMIVDPANGVPEVNENNNRASNTTGIRLLRGKPDLAVTRVLTSATNVTAGDTVPLTVRVTNVGGEPAVNSEIAVMLTTNPVVSPQDAALSSYTVSLGAGEFDERVIDVTIPANANSGVFRLGALADPDSTLDELSETNNGRAASTDLIITGGDVAIITTLLPAGYVRQSYVGLLVAVGGSADRTWSVVQGQLPTGLGLVGATGEIYGRPTRAESQTFTVQVDSNSQTDTQTLTLMVVEPEQPLTIVTRDVPEGIVGQEYSFQLVATGGTANATIAWSATGLPDGMALSSDGVLSGTPIAAAETPVNVTATDGAATAVRELLLVVRDNANLLITPSQLPPATYGMAYSFQITSTGGVQPIAYLLQFGQLPTGLTMSTDGLISGTPMQVSRDPFRFSVEARDSAPGTPARDVNAFELTVNDVDGFRISTESLPIGYLNEGYDVKIAAEGGSQPYTWSVEGDLPPGLATSVSGASNELIIAGQASQLGQYTLTFRVIDAEGRSSTRALAIRIIEKPAMLAPPTDDGGCGCSSDRADAPLSGSLALLVLGALLLIRRR